MRRAALDDLLDAPHDLVAIIRVNAVGPPCAGRLDFAFGVLEKRMNRLVPANMVACQVPVPDRVIGRPGG
jgi:hypothetical protein